MTNKEMIEVIQAYDNGQEIECAFASVINRTWSITKPNEIYGFDFHKYDYRIKPAPVKKYWSCPADVPLDAVFIRAKVWGDNVRATINKVDNLGIIYYDDLRYRVEWMELPKYEYYDGKEWRECIVEGEV